MSCFTVRPIFSGPKSVQASVVLLEQLPIILEKSSKQEVETSILPMVYMALESNMSQVQVRRFHYFSQHAAASLT